MGARFETRPQLWPARSSILYCETGSQAGAALEQFVHLATIYVQRVTQPAKWAICQKSIVYVITASPQSPHPLFAIQLVDTRCGRIRSEEACLREDPYKIATGLLSLDCQYWPQLSA